jgi:hypothetical protein
MKTSMVQQKRLIEEIQSSTLVVGIRLLRDWLKDNGYEGSEDCKHYAILRSTGKCMNCAALVTEPIILNSDDAIEALRDRLGG